MNEQLLKRYEPFWLHQLDKAEREEVVDWVSVHGIDPQLCAYFDVTFGVNHSVRCKMYRTENGSPLINRETMEVEWDKDEVFSTNWLPAAIERDHPARRSAK
jgi:hypothetical protein